MCFHVTGKELTWASSYPANVTTLGEKGEKITAVCQKHLQFYSSGYRKNSAPVVYYYRLSSSISVYHSTMSESDTLKWASRGFRTDLRYWLQRSDPDPVPSSTRTWPIAVHHQLKMHLLAPDRERQPWVYSWLFNKVSEGWFCKV